VWPLAAALQRLICESAIPGGFRIERCGSNLMISGGRRKDLMISGGLRVFFKHGSTMFIVFFGEGKLRYVGVGAGTT